MFDNVLHVIGIIFAALFCVVMIVGFWRGLSMRPHRPDNQPKPPPFWWYTGP
jgi:hypothetical protein